MNIVNVEKALSSFYLENEKIMNRKHCIYQGDKLSLSENFYFRKNLIELQDDEVIWMHAGGKLKNGFAFTNFGFHFDTVRNSFFSSILMLPKDTHAFINYNDLKSLQIGYSDKCYGSNYYGHSLIVNGEDYGLVRMSNGIVYDEPAIVYCNRLFNRLVGICLEKGPDLDEYPNTLI